LLPEAATKEKLAESLTAFKFVIEKKVGGEMRTRLAGATPPGSGSTSPTTPPGDESDIDYLWDQMVNAKDNQTFEEMRKKWVAVKNKNSKPS
jgi:hypothetical protein